LGISGHRHASLGNLLLSYLPEVSRYPDHLAAQDSSRQSRPTLAGGDEARFPMKNRLSFALQRFKLTIIAFSLIALYIAAMIAMA
jgi:hypothetical protein